MIITTAEYKALFGNKNPSEISNEDIIKAREKKTVRCGPHFIYI